MSVLLGAIADDFTGATDLCNTLVRRGMRTVQLIDVPAPGAEVADAEAVVVALKSRTIPAAEAIEKSLAALAWLQTGRGAPDPVQILLDLRFDRRRQYRAGRRGADGCARHRLHAVLPGLSRSRPDDLPRLSVRRRRAALGIGHARPSADPDARPEPGTRSAAAEPRPGRAGAGRDRRRAAPRRSAPPSPSCSRQGFRHTIVDAIEDRHLEAIGAAAADFKLITGGSGIALGLPENFRRQGLLGDNGGSRPCPRSPARRRCCPGPARRRPSRRSPIMRERAPVFTVDPIAIAEGRRVAEDALDWAKPLLGDRPDTDLGDGTARDGRGSAAPARPRTRRGLGRGDARRNRPRPCRQRRRGGSSSPAARPPARSSRRSASPACASAGRSIPVCRGR